MTTTRSTARHRAAVRPRYGRIATSMVAVAVTSTAVFGGIGGPGGDGAAADVSAGSAADLGGSTGASTVEPVTGASPAETSSRVSAPSTAARRVPEAAGRATPVPVKSGAGDRIVFSEGQQRVWLIDADEASADTHGVFRSYLVSGSELDNLEPGTYEVFSRSRHAVGIDDSGTMEYFVRFTHGTQGAAIGFHTIPVKDGDPVQTERQLGTPLSHGCIRQARADAIALWDFAALGTTVVVTA